MYSKHSRDNKHQTQNTPDRQHRRSSEDKRERSPRGYNPYRPDENFTNSHPKRPLNVEQPIQNKRRKRDELVPSSLEHEKDLNCYEENVLLIQHQPLYNAIHRAATPNKPLDFGNLIALIKPAKLSFTHLSRLSSFLLTFQKENHQRFKDPRKCDQALYRQFADLVSLLFSKLDRYLKYEPPLSACWKQEGLSQRARFIALLLNNVGQLAYHSTHVLQPQRLNYLMKHFVGLIKFSPIPDQEKFSCAALYGLNELMKAKKGKLDEMQHLNKLMKIILSLPKAAYAISYVFCLLAKLVEQSSPSINMVKTNLLSDLQKKFAQSKDADGFCIRSVFVGLATCIEHNAFKNVIEVDQINQIVEKMITLVPMPNDTPRDIPKVIASIGKLRNGLQGDLNIGQLKQLLVKTNLSNIDYSSCVTLLEGLSLLTKQGQFKPGSFDVQFIRFFNDLIARGKEPELGDRGIFHDKEDYVSDKEGIFNFLLKFEIQKKPILLQDRQYPRDIVSMPHRLTFDIRQAFVNPTLYSLSDLTRVINEVSSLNLSHILDLSQSLVGLKNNTPLLHNSKMNEVFSGLVAALFSKIGPCLNNKPLQIKVKTESHLKLEKQLEDRCDLIGNLLYGIRRLSEHQFYVLSAEHAAYLLEHLSILILSLQEQPDSRLRLNVHTRLIKVVLQEVRLLAQSNQLNGKVEEKPINELLKALTRFPNASSVSFVIAAAFNLIGWLILKSHLQKDQVDYLLTQKLFEKVVQSDESSIEDIHLVLFGLQNILRESELKDIVTSEEVLNTLLKRLASQNVKGEVVAQVQEQIARFKEVKAKSKDQHRGDGAQEDLTDSSKPSDVQRPVRTPLVNLEPTISNVLENEKTNEAKSFILKIPHEKIPHETGEADKGGSNQKPPKIKIDFSKYSLFKFKPATEILIQETPSNPDNSQIDTLFQAQHPEDEPCKPQEELFVGVEMTPEERLYHVFEGYFDNSLESIAPYNNSTYSFLESAFISKTDSTNRKEDELERQEVSQQSVVKPLELKENVEESFASSMAVEGPFIELDILLDDERENNPCLEDSGVSFVPCNKDQSIAGRKNHFFWDPNNSKKLQLAPNNPVKQPEETKNEFQELFQLSTWDDLDYNDDFTPYQF